MMHSRFAEERALEGESGEGTSGPRSLFFYLSSSRKAAQNAARLLCPPLSAWWNSTRELDPARYIVLVLRGGLRVRC